MEVKVLDRRTQSGLGGGVGSGTSKGPIASSVTVTRVPCPSCEVGCKGAGLHTEGVSYHHETL